jgi:hypothetical protein
VDPKPEARNNAFFDLERDQQRNELTRPASLLKSTEWGGLTLVSLLASLAFPPYFVQVLLLASLQAGGLLWVTHLNEAGRARLREFEREFAQGHTLEEQGRWAEALAFYQALAPRYKDQPKVADIALQRIEVLKARRPAPRKSAKPARRKAKP